MVGAVNVVVFVIVVALFLFNNYKLKTNVDHMINVDQTVLIDLEQMYAQGLQTGQATRNVILDPANKKGVDNYNAAHAAFLKLNNEALALSSGKTKEALAKVQSLWVEDHKLKLEAQRLAIAGKSREAVELLNSKETTLWREIKDTLQKASADQQSLFKKQIQGIDSIMEIGTITLVIVILFSAGGVLLFLFLVGKSTGKNINVALSCLGTLERGELTAGSRITDDHNFLKDIYNRIHASLRQTVVNIQGVAKKVTVNTAALTEDLKTIDASAREQLAQIDQIASASTEMSQTITDVARNATSASEAARDATEVAFQGKGIVQQSVMAMQSISLSVNGASATIEDLKESLKEVEEIVSIINDISDQTNLLALNAAIEAARAGEQGRGFSVVADEVRKLAERTGKATGEIAGKLDAVRQKSEASVQVMQQSRQDAEKGVAYADDTIQALNSIVAAAEKAGGLIHTIAVASEEQSVASEEIAGNMEKIAASVNGTVSMLADAYKEVEQLDNQAKELNASIGFFKLG